MGPERESRSRPLLIKPNKTDELHSLQEVFGGNAVSDEYHIGRHVSNLFVTQTYEGQSDIHCKFAGRFTSFENTNANHLTSTDPRTCYHGDPSICIVLPVSAASVLGSSLHTVLRFHGSWITHSAVYNKFVETVEQSSPFCRQHQVNATGLCHAPTLPPPRALLRRRRWTLHLSP